MMLIIYQLVNQSIKCPMKKYIMTTLELRKSEHINLQQQKATKGIISVG